MSAAVSDWSEALLASLAGKLLNKWYEEGRSQ